MSSKSETKQFKPCPFCGGEPYYHRSVNGSQMHHLGCSTCGIEFKAAEVHYPGKTGLSKDIVAAWNRRVELIPAEPGRSDSSQFDVASQVLQELLKWDNRRPYAGFMTDLAAIIETARRFVTVEEPGSDEGQRLGTCDAALGGSPQIPHVPLQMGTCDEYHSEHERRHCRDFHRESWSSWKPLPSEPPSLFCGKHGQVDVGHRCAEYDGEPPAQPESPSPAVADIKGLYLILEKVYAAHGGDGCPICKSIDFALMDTRNKYGFEDTLVRLGGAQPESKQRDVDAACNTWDANLKRRQRIRELIDYLERCSKHLFNGHADSGFWSELRDLLREEGINA